MSYIIVYNRPWCQKLPSALQKKTGEEFFYINKKDHLTFNKVKTLNPKYIFFPHWSYIIPEQIYKNFICVIFHMTDLPYGRGGSPLQNLIVRGHKNTMISAIKCVKEVDGGPIYFKEPLSLEGTAEEIYIRANTVIEKMIINFIKYNYKPKPQIGKVVKFYRRKPEEGDLVNTKSLNDVYDYIRMLDANGYPASFITFGDFKLEFSNAVLKKEELVAKVRFIKKGKNE